MNAQAEIPTMVSPTPATSTPVPCVLFKRSLLAITVEFLAIPLSKPLLFVILSHATFTIVK